MTDDVFPFTLDIDCRDGRRVSVECLDVLRAIERTRKVYDARWEGRPVIVKVFVKAGKAWYHMRREQRGIGKLEARQLNTPHLLFCGRTPNGWAVVTEKIAGAVTAMDIWLRNRASEEEVSILSRIGAELARQHIKGVIQTDLHLGNFLVKEDTVFLLDPSTMRFRPGQIGRSSSMKQLARLTSVLPERTSQPAIETVFSRYAAIRGWPVRPRDLQQLCETQKRSRQGAIERGLQKFLRTNRRHQAIHQEPWKGIAERDVFKAVGLAGLTAGLDKAGSQGQVFKNGGTCFVSRIHLGGIDVVVKRYNHKGLIHSLRHTLKGSRARQGWVSANRLRLLGIPTPRPVAYVDEYRGPLLWRSYLVTEFVAGRSLHEVLRDETLPDDRKQHWIDETLRLIDRLADHGITHGDLKHTNILCNETKVVLTDLDAMQVHRMGYRKRRRYEKDRARLLRELDVDSLRGRSAVQAPDDR